MPIQTYLSEITTRHKTGISREHSYRGDLQPLPGTLLKDLLVTNDPASRNLLCLVPGHVTSMGKNQENSADVVW